MNKIFWDDDSQIVAMHAEKMYGSPARTEVEITEFPEGEEHQRFHGQFPEDK